MTGKTLLIGNGDCLERIARGLPAEKTEIIVVNPEKLEGLEVPESPERPAGIKVISCSGTAGNFEVVLEADGKRRSVQAGKVIIADDYRRIPNFKDFGLTPGKGCMAMSDFRVRLLDDGVSLSGVETVCFVVGLAGESNPEATREVMETAWKVQTDLGKKTYILTGNLKVAGRGLERLYRETREAGVFYAKFTDERPGMEQDVDGKVRFRFTDEITGMAFGLTPDLTVVDEVFAPSGFTREMIDRLRLEKNGGGFAQSENVHRVPLFTNRKGIFVAGPSRSVLSMDDPAQEAENAVLSCLYPAVSGEPELPVAVIDTGPCVRCLTCYRLCPYRAIRVEASLRVDPSACEGCGICVSECPMETIRIEGLHPDALMNRDAQTGEGQVARPAITLFCCGRSSAKAVVLAKRLEGDLSAEFRVVEVPCGGAVSLMHILSAFQHGADGVMVLTCHEGNCHSGSGNLLARERVELIKTRLEEIGFPGNRLFFGTLASNMGKECAEMLHGFAASLKNGIRSLPPEMAPA